MQKIIYIGVLFCLACVWNGCKKYETRNEGAWTDAQAKKGIGMPRFIVYATDKGIFMTGKGLRNTKQILKDSVSVITRVSISPNHDKIAYRTNLGKINVIDSTGKKLVSNLAGDNIKFFEWHSNNQLLYGVKNEYRVNEVVALQGVLPAGLPRYAPADISEVLLFAYITKENDLFYSTALVGWNTYSYLVYIKNGSTVQQKKMHITGYFAPQDIRIMNCSTEGVSFDFDRSMTAYFTIENRAFTAYFNQQNDEVWLDFPDGSVIKRNNIRLTYVPTSSESRYCPNGECQFPDTEIFDAK
jgi:hypothetical protein